MRSFCWIALAVVGMLAAGCAPGAAAPPYPCPWFIEHVQLGAMELPAGVRVERGASQSVSGRYIGDAIVLRNTSSTPLYVIGIYHYEPPPQDEHLPFVPAPGTGAANRIVNGKPSAWMESYNAATSSFRYSWVGDNNDHRPDSVWVEFGLNNGMVTDAGRVVELRPLNRYGEGRPEGVALPGPQEAVLPLVYGAQPLNIPFTVSYSLSDNYTCVPPTFSDYVSPQLQVCLLVACLYLLGAVMLWYFIRLLRKTRG